MPLLSLPATIEGTALSPRSQSFLHNMYNIRGVLVTREGYERTDKYDEDSRPATADDRIGRGLMVSADGEKMYCIFGKSVYTTVFVSGVLKIGTAIFTNASFLSPEYTTLSYAVGFTGIAIAGGTTQDADNNNLFINTTTDVCTALTDTDLPIAKSVEYLNGKYIWMAADGTSVYWSEIDDAGNIDPLSFFDAESRPDPNKEQAVIGNDYYVLGSRSVERFSDVGTTAAPFIRATNSSLAVGYVGGLIRLSDRIVFIGRRVGGGLGVYEMNGSSITEISNDSVREMLNCPLSANLQEINTTTGNGGIDEAVAQSFNSYGAEIYTFIINHITLYCMAAGDGYQWGFLGDQADSGTFPSRDWGVYDWSHDPTGTTDPFNRLFRFVGHTSFKGNWYCQRSIDIDDAGLFIKSTNRLTVNVDTSESTWYITRGARFALRSDEDRDFNFSRLELVYSKQGVNRVSVQTTNPTGGDSTDTVSLRVSNTGVGWGYISGSSGDSDGQSWSDRLEEPYGNLGDSGRLEFRASGGLSSGDGYIGIVLESKSEIPLTIEKVIVS